MIERVRVCLIDPQDGRNSRRLDVEYPGVHDFTVDLHHHLKLFVFNDALIVIYSWQDHRHLGAAAFVVVGGGKEEVIPAERDHVECVPSSVEFIKEVIVGAVRGVIHLQLTAGSLFRGIGVLDLRYLSPFICCFLLDKENKKVTSFYVFDKA